MRILRKHPYWALVLIAVVIAGGVYGVRSIRAQPEPPPADKPPGPQVEGRLMDIIFEEGYGVLFCEFDAVVEVTKDGTVVAKLPARIEEGLPVAAGERVEDYKPLPNASATTVYRGGDGILRQGCAPESLRFPEDPKIWN